MYGMTNAGGGGSGSFKKTATGSLSPGKTFTVSDLSFRPRIVILYAEIKRQQYFHSFVCVGLFDKNGDLIIWRPSYFMGAHEINHDLDTVTVSDNGFSVTFGDLNGSAWPAGNVLQLVYFCYG